MVAANDSERLGGGGARGASGCSMKNFDLSELPPSLRAKVLAFRRELIAEREEHEKELREALDHFKREAEIETAVLRRLAEIFEDARQSDGMAADAAPSEELKLSHSRRRLLCIPAKFVGRCCRWVDGVEKGL